MDKDKKIKQIKGNASKENRNPKNLSIGVVPNKQTTNPIQFQTR